MRRTSAAGSSSSSASVGYGGGSALSALASNATSNLLANLNGNAALRWGLDWLLANAAGANLPLFKEVEAAIQDKKAVAKAAEIYERVAGEMAAQEAALDHLQGLGNG